MGKLLRGREGGRVDGNAQNRHHEEWPASGSCAQVRRQITDALSISRVLRTGCVPTSAGMEMRIERTAIAIAPLEFSVSAEAGTLPFSTSGRRAAPSCQTRSVSLAERSSRRCACTEAPAGASQVLQSSSGPFMGTGFSLWSAMDRRRASSGGENLLPARPIELTGTVSGLHFFSASYSTARRQRAARLQGTKASVGGSACFLRLQLAPPEGSTAGHMFRNLLSYAQRRPKEHDLVKKWKVVKGDTVRADPPLARSNA